MTILASVNPRTYAPQVSVVNFAVAANVTAVLVTMTHANTLTDWPAGPLVQMDWDWGNGSTGTFQTGGGIRNDKSGVPVVGNVSTTFGTTKPPGIAAGKVTITILQTLTSAVLVEGF